MAVIINTATDDFHFRSDPNMRLWAYNGLDCCVTHAVAGELRPQVALRSERAYRFALAMQGPALDMMRRGIAVNAKVKRDESQRLHREREAKEALLNKLAEAVWGQGLNSNSPKQMTAFFYGALGMPAQYAIRKTPQGKVRTLSCDHKALETLAKLEVRGPGCEGDRLVPKVRLAKPFVTLVTAIRDTVKKIAVVNSAGDRFYCSYNVAGTRTYRWSSSSNALNQGSNLQNITPAMRRMCCADDGKKLGSPDLEQAESRVVAGLTWACTGDDTYWKACESGDLHTIVCTMAYPEEFVVDGKSIGGWDFDQGKFVGDLKACRVIADQPFYRHLTMRDLAKRIGHGSNYWGTAYGIAMMIGDIPVAVVAEFQRRYFRAFPAIQKWHSYVIRMVQTHNKLETPWGWVRPFFGRTADDSTLREAIAHVPQSTIGMLLNLMLYRVWRFGIDGGQLTVPTPTTPRTIRFRDACQLLLQVHDSITFQYPDDPHVEAAVIAKVNDLMSFKLPIPRVDFNTGEKTGEVRELSVPLEFQVGWNWGKLDKKRKTFSDGNPDGLDTWAGPYADQRKRQQGAKPSLADWMG